MQKKKTEKKWQDICIFLDNAFELGALNSPGYYENNHSHQSTC